jgi:hypothetical protein
VEATETARLWFGAGAIVLPGVEPGLVDAALEALYAAAGREGRWLDGRVILEAAAGAERTTDQIASVSYRYQRRNDQELPWEDWRRRGTPGPALSCRPSCGKRMQSLDLRLYFMDRRCSSRRAFP